MFEDSTFESTGKIHTRSTRWMLATFALNGSILAAMILIPLIYPAAIPRFNPITLIEAPTTPPEAPKPVHVPAGAVMVRPTFDPNELTAPSKIPKIIVAPTVPDVLVPTDGLDNSARNGSNSLDNVFGPVKHPVVLVKKPQGPTAVPSVLMEGLLLRKVIPVYSPIAKASGTQGTVVLQATISKAGMIENLRVVSGSPLLAQSALDAVAQWRYRPYLLNGEPIEVETTVNVVFKLN